MYIMNNCIKFLLILIAILGGIYLLNEIFKKCNFEFFTNNSLKAGKYPERVVSPLLSPPFGDFEKNKKAGLFKTNSETHYQLFSKTALSNYKQITNNQKNWVSPCNGTDIPFGICGGLYKKRNVKAPITQLPPEKGKRINYYNYCN